MTNEFEHFIEAQTGIYEQVLRELREGRKRTHWMWFVFPQARGLGYSFMSQKFAIGSFDQARRYLDHEVLGARLRECTQAVSNLEGRSVDQIFGSPDNLKFRSSMTLFDAACPEERIFDSTLTKYFSGERDGRTIELLS